MVVSNIFSRRMKSIVASMTLAILALQQGKLLHHVHLSTTDSTTSDALSQLPEDHFSAIKKQIMESKDYPEDEDCPFRNSPIYRSVYVYPSPGEEAWQGDILSEQGKNTTEPWPWVDADQRAKLQSKFHYDPKSSAVQYTTEILVREILTNTNSCLRTHDPEQATLFYVPYLPSAEYHNVTNWLGDYKTSSYGQAIMDVIDGRYASWEHTFGLTSKYWSRRSGSDHILVFGEPLHGLSHTKSKKGNFHFIHSQKQLTPPIVISVELSTTFVEMYPNCARKNILMPYPNTDGEWFNGKLNQEMSRNLEKAGLDATKSDAALPTEKLRALRNETARPLAQYYSGGNHGSCAPLRRAMKRDFDCTPSGKISPKIAKSWSLAYRAATFCPCPGGDSPSAKRMFDALLAGCIPIILSQDFVWPFTNEFDPPRSLDPSDFSIRLQASDYLQPHADEECTWKNQSGSLHAKLESIDAAEIQRLRQGVERVRDLYAYYRTSEDLPNNPLKEGILPDGGAAHALVAALAERASGAYWPACQAELQSSSYKNVNRFKC
jgi:hypothetical protein